MANKNRHKSWQYPLILQTVAQKRLTETIKILIVEFRTFFVIENKIVIKIFSN